MQTEPQQSKLSIPAAIVITGVIIALGIVVSNTKIAAPASQAPSSAPAANINIPPVSSTDHIMGDASAPVVIVEYSDFECPYCQMFESTMQSVMSEYAASGSVAWVYREFPLTSIHPQAQPAALAAECISHELGNDAFWKFVVAIFADQSKMSPDYYASLAAGYGANPATFASCVSSGAYQSVLDSETGDAEAAGAEGTPFSVMVLKSPLSAAAASAIGQIVSQNGITDQNGNPLIVVSGDKTKISLAGAMPLQVVDAILKIVLQK